MSKSKSSRRWLVRHSDDEFVKRAAQEGYRSRAAYKLLEIQQKDRILRPGLRVVDLGAAPGGWSQVAARLTGRQGRVIALDLLEMDALAGVTFLQGDFRDVETLERLRDLLQGEPVDLVISDMAPNLSGVRAVDQPRAMYLCELTLDLAREMLKPGGDLAIKVFQGEGFERFLSDLRGAFAKVTTRKPKASRPHSREVYLVARNYNV